MRNKINNTIINIEGEEKHEECYAWKKVVMDEAIKGGKHKNEIKPPIPFQRPIPA